MSVIKNMDCLGRLCFMYQVCSLYCCRVRLVRPMYESLQVLQVSLYIPLLSFSVLCWYGVCCSICCMVFVVLYVICKFVCLNRLVIVRMVGLKYVKVFLIFIGCDVLVVWFVLLLCWMCWCIQLMWCTGNPLFFAMVYIMFHSVCHQGLMVGNAFVTGQAADLYSIGWFDVWCMVVSVVVGFLYMLIFKFCVFLIICKSKKFMVLLVS